MAVAARSPGSPDSPSARPGLGRDRAAQREDAPVPRVPCPLCGGAIHPVAGRCKHCKQDLLAHRGRGGAGAASSSLPRLAAGTGPMGQGSLSPSAVTIGLPAHPVEAPRQTRRGWLSNWPLIVITLAVVAMIVALVLLVLPQHDGGSRGGKRLPGGDNMETDVLPRSGKSGAIDPWAPSPRANSGRDPGADPGPSSQANPPPAPVPPDDVDPDAARDDDGISGGVQGSIDDDDDLGGMAGGVAPADPSDPADPSAPGLSDPFAAQGNDPGDVVTPDEIDRLDALSDPYELFGRDVSAVSLMSAHACARAAECSGRRARLAACAKLVQPRKGQSPVLPRCNNTVMLLTCLQQIDSLPCGTHPTMDLVQRIPACLHLLGC